MPDFLDTASAWLDTVCKEQISQTVVISSGAAVSGNVSATIGSTEFQQDNGEGILTTWQSRDYFIAVADYKLSGVVVAPEPGHLITEAARVYEVVSPGDEPCARYSDASQRTWRVHTKLISK
jgi:hypothetical protein